MKILWCIKKCLFKHSVIILYIYSDYFWRHTKKQNRFCQKLATGKNSSFSFNFFVVFPDAFQNYGDYFTFGPPKYQLDSLPTGKDADKENRSTFIALKRSDRHIKKHIIVKSIHQSLHLESKI